MICSKTLDVMFHNNDEWWFGICLSAKLSTLELKRIAWNYWNIITAICSTRILFFRNSRKNNILATVKCQLKLIGTVKSNETASANKLTYDQNMKTLDITEIAYVSSV